MRRDTMHYFPPRCCPRRSVNMHFPEGAIGRIFIASGPHAGEVVLRDQFVELFAADPTLQACVVTKQMWTGIATRH